MPHNPDHNDVRQIRNDRASASSHHGRKVSLAISVANVSAFSLAFLLVMIAGIANADTLYYHHIFFDNSLERDAYFYSSGNASAPSVLNLVHGKLPVETKVFYTPPNALRLEWTSARTGGRDARIDVTGF